MKSIFILSLFTVALLVTACQTTPSNRASSELTDKEVVTKVSQSTATEGVYVDYTQAVYNDMLGKKPFALFFHASWCPTCKAMEKDILGSLDSFPQGSVILKADYDTEIALKKQYNITSQSLVVMFNADGSVAETLVAPTASILQSYFANLL